MEHVTLINRTTKNLEGIWDGRYYTLAPGKHSFPRTMAEKFQQQNPVMGTQNKYSGEIQYLIGIEENGDDCSPTEQSNAISLEDLSEKIASGELKVVKGNGMYGFADRTAPLPPDNAFVKP